MVQNRQNAGSTWKHRNCQFCIGRFGCDQSGKSRLLVHRLQAAKCSSSSRKLYFLVTAQNFIIAMHGYTSAMLPQPRECSSGARYCSADIWFKTGCLSPYLDNHALSSRHAWSLSRVTDRWGAARGSEGQCVQASSPQSLPKSLEMVSPSLSPYARAKTALKPLS